MPASFLSKDQRNVIETIKALVKEKWNDCPIQFSHSDGQEYEKVIRKNNITVYVNRFKKYDLILVTYKNIDVAEWYSKRNKYPKYFSGHVNFIRISNDELVKCLNGEENVVV